jgi:hypothetical protein
LAGEAKSYAERLFKFPAIGRLDGPDATAALVAPAQALRVAYTEGYPYFHHEYGNEPP